MNSKQARQWCEQNSWTELRQLENGIWVAFPPGGVMETPLPQQQNRPPIQVKASTMENLLAGTLLLTSSFVIALVSLAIAPWFSIYASKKNFD